MRYTVYFLSEEYANSCAAYFECLGMRLDNVSPMEILMRQAQTLSRLDQSHVHPNDTYENLESYRSKSIVPFVFYDEADLLWAMKDNDFVHCIRLIGQLHSIGNHGYSFGCLSGSTRKLTSLAFKTKFE
jgi:hypothetical protein